MTTAAVTETGVMPTQNHLRDFVLSSWNDGIYRRTIFVVFTKERTVIFVYGF